jgi:uncharacterized protein (DUF2126 family)
VAAFWNQPYGKPLSHWETSLHDKFMLPHFVWQDLYEAIGEIELEGTKFDPQWFVPHFEFRFPKIGEVNYQGISMQLRSAIEPWYVMGEEPGGGGTARFVDSSVERIEVLVDHFDPSRFAILCNGVNVPMHSTSVQGQYVAGIRFRAWQPPRCLHPTIGVHTPLRIEMVDTRNRRSIGGCTYHVSHPGGRGTDRFPINANEAESRRAARFEDFGMTGGSIDVPAPVSPHVHGLGYRPYPVTLDLRRIN